MQAEEQGWPNEANSGLEPTEAPRKHGGDAHGGSRDADGRYRRPGLGVLAGLGAFVLVAIPAGWSAYFALVSFTGCFIECGKPEVGTGVLWGSLATFLLAVPVITGLVVARVPLRRGLPWLMGLGGAVTLAGVLAQRVI
ncbi:MAG TPA: hypothetical protein VFR23_18810 [Jiangellaceae bacterium]|nr:hypothetical protein [Jiangellaceae bacterium]